MFRESMKTLILIAVVGCFFASDVFAYKIITTGGKEVRWKNNEAHYKISNVGSKDFAGGSDGAGQKISEFTAINNSFNTWMSVDDIDLNAYFDGYSTKTKTGMDNENTIQWVESGWMNLDFQPPATALAVTISSYDLGSGEMVDADIHFNNEFFDWAVVDSDEESFSIDLPSIATHEIGHFFGLDHSSEDPFEANAMYLDSTMYYAAVPGDTSARSLNDDDVVALQHLYPINKDVGDPLIYEITPSQGRNSEILNNVEITGTNFRENAAVVLTMGKDEVPDIFAREVNVSSDGTRITCNFDLRNAYSGKYHLKIFNNYSSDDMVKNAFEVTAAISGSDGKSGRSYMYETASYGCGVVKGNKSISSLSFLAIILLIFPLILFFSARLNPSTVKVVNLRSLIKFIRSRK